MSKPGSHPSPPTDLAGRRLPITKFAGPWFRVHRVTKGALYFGTSAANRFDAPAAEFGVLYVARREPGAFIETFGHDTGIRVLDTQELAARALSRIDPSRPLRLVDLRGKGLARIGADSELLAGNYTLSQAWALALHEHPSLPDGIAYRARHDPEQISAAIFERAKNAVAATLLGSFAEPPLARLLAALLDRYDFGLV